MLRLSGVLLLAALCLAQTGAKSGIDVDGLDKTCKPCEDFWRYANGNFLDKNPIPAKYPNWGSFLILRDANAERLKVILENAANDKSADADKRRVGDFYASCMNTTAIESAGAKPIQPELQRIAKVGTRQALVAELLSLEKESGLAPTSLGSTPDPSDASTMIAEVRAGGLSLPDRDYYLQDDERSKNIRAEFLQHIARMLALAGVSPEAAAAESKTILEFETVLARASFTNVQRRDPYLNLHRMDLAQLQALEPRYDWAGVIKILGVPPGIAINVEQPEFLKVVDRQLGDAPLETWKTWLRWRIVNDRAQFLSKNFYDEWFHFRRTVLTGVKEQQPRWQVCATLTDAWMGEALGKLFAQKHFPAESKRRMTDLVENMRDAFKDQLEGAEWLDPETRKNALRKLSAFEAHIGYPDKFRDYSRVVAKRGDYMATVISAALESRRFDLAKIGGKVDRHEMRMTPPTVNASYSPDRNTINFPAGILQPPFFMPDADDAVNYGGIGAVIGHEMGHGFDDQGARFDADGSLRNWWTAEDLRKFDARAACVTAQFDAFDVGEGLHHNGKLVTGEAMGDLGGLTLAYKAYHKALKGREAPVLDGFTGDQRFFLAFARVWATRARAEQDRLQLKTDPHPLAKFRANGTLQNMPEFHKAFGCKEGDPMVRSADKQCRLW